MINFHKMITFSLDSFLDKNDLKIIFNEKLNPLWKLLLKLLYPISIKLLTYSGLLCNQYHIQTFGSLGAIISKHITSMKLEHETNSLLYSIVVIYPFTYTVSFVELFWGEISISFESVRTYFVAACTMFSGNKFLNKS
jgi:hypothetical protein